MFGLSESFHSFESWSNWAGRNPFVEDDQFVYTLAKGIKTKGFTEPLTGRSVAAEAIQTADQNWREALIANGLNSRMRAVLALIENAATGHNVYDLRLFATEAVTDFALLLRGIFPKFLGSEYGVDEAARRALFPIQHQDLTDLKLPSDTFDIVTTNEVLEHVPDLDAALHEITRVLKPNGVHIGMHPFLHQQRNGDVRATLIDGELTHLMPPEYHGNPVDSAGGSLVFETPGWDILDRARAAGLSDARMRFVASEAHGYMTQHVGVFVFWARK